MQINLMELWASMGLPVRGVVILLTLQAVACVAVVLDRFVVLMTSGARARDFAAAVQGAMESGDYALVLSKVSSVKPNHLTGYLELGLRTFMSRREAGDSHERAAELAQRALERRGDAISRDLNRGMNVLASTGSTAPFVGLLGTVLGIINAFKMIAATGSGGIGTIGAAIGEALIVTGYGLCVAIPSVLVFNWLSGRIADYEAGLLNAGSELVDRMETSGGPKAALASSHRVAASAPPPAASDAEAAPAPSDTDAAPSAAPRAEAEASSFAE